MPKNLLLLFSLITIQYTYSQNYTISGYVRDKNSGESIIGAYVIDSTGKSVTQTNNYGFFTLKNISGNASIQATFIGLKSEMLRFSLMHDTMLTIIMQPIMELDEVIISSSLYEHNVNTPLSLSTIPVKRLTSIPALGEADLLKSIQSQPGIKGGVEGSAGIFVRGGGSGENLFMLDDVPIYNVSHLYGFFSAFNSSVVKDIKLMKGCFPARYGGRTSSVVDVRTRDGNNKNLTGEVSIGIISSRFNIEGPLLSDKTTFIVSGRRSYFDLYSGLLKKLGAMTQDFPGYYFYDLNLRLTHSVSAEDKLFLSIYNGRDKIRYINEATITDDFNVVFSDYRNETSGWGNVIGSLRWNHAFARNAFANTTLAFSTYDFYTENQYSSSFIDSLLVKRNEKSYLGRYNSVISDLIIKTDFDYSLTKNHKLMFGMGNAFQNFNPGKNKYRLFDQDANKKIDTSFINNTLHASEPFLYLEDEITAIKKVKINTGIRLSGIISEDGTFFNLEPRISANFTIISNLAVKAGYSHMVQYIHLLSTSGLTRPTDIWVPALKGLRPLKSDQLNAGISYDANKVILVSVELYRKWLYNTTDFRNGASLLADLSPWYAKTTQGEGDAKGIEVSVEKQQGRLSGSINYTLSSATRRYADLNNGLTFPFRYDRLHDLNISMNYNISDKWDVSLFWVVGTGYPVTVPVEKYSPLIGNAWIPIYYFPSVNNCRLPAYHRLDIGLHHKKQTRFGERSLSIDIFNAYNRKNPVSIYFWQNYSFKYNYLLPIIPSVTYSLKFK